MNTTSHIRRIGAVFTAAAVTLSAAACGIEKQAAPELTGPSELATSITLTATPDVVNRDGASQATIGVLARNATGAPMSGLAVNLSLTPSNGGVLSAAQVVTDSAGRAAFTFTAPTIDTLVNSVTIGATPMGTNFDNAVTRSVVVALSAPDAATPAFTVSPASPQRFQPATLNAAGTQFQGAPCNSACTYTWTIGSEATLTGQVVTYSFQQQTTYAVVLEVTSPTGVRTRTQQSVVVTAGTAPTAAFSASPTNPVTGQTVFFNASASTAANGATIASYEWDFGNGQTAQGATASTSYATENIFVVTLTVTDSNGQRARATLNLTISAP